ncbi:hypothetical protein [Chromatocurvus halotolerans]|uniref:hypothetical protein n=1 Tax=Chromatocurvus halotolerans TaxID=1132028 RepID=UPI0013C2AAC2|nr:hypothetical protein [Chromatocurvus halotolerans]
MTTISCSIDGAGEATTGLADNIVNAMRLDATDAFLKRGRREAASASPPFLE